MRKELGDRVAARAREAAYAVERFPTGSIALDRALEGGWTRGRIYELYGSEAAGKTTLALTAIREAQRARLGPPAYVDVEKALDFSYAEKIGLDMDGWIHSEPADGESALEAVRRFVLAGVPLVVCDTVAALAPRAELAGEMGDAHVGRQARLMSQGLRILASDVKNHRTTLLFLNQIREKVGIVFGDPRTTPGGHALRHYASVRLEVRRTSKKILKGEKVLGHWVRVYVQKSKVSIPFVKAEFPLVSSVGIDPAREAWVLGLAEGILEPVGKKGAKFGDSKWAGPEAFAKDPPALASVVARLGRRG